MGLLLPIWLGSQQFLYVCLHFVYTDTLKYAMTAPTPFPFSFFHWTLHITCAAEEVSLRNLRNNETEAVFFRRCWFIILGCESVSCGTWWWVWNVVPFWGGSHFWTLMVSSWRYCVRTDNFLEKSISYVCFSSYAFYSMNPLDTHIMQRSLLATIYIFLAFNRFSVL